VFAAGRKTIRPPQQYTSAFDLRSLWPEPRATAADGWNADLKDELETVLVRQVCSGHVPLTEAQQAISTDWIAAYNRFVVGK
jgi:hypothetical protein